MKKDKFSDEFYVKLIILFTIAFSFFSVIGSAQIFGINSDLNKDIEAQKEADRPAELSVSIINADCDECISIKDAVNNIEKLNVNLKRSEMDFSSKEAKELIKKYNIKKLPVAIFIGETDKTTLLKRKISEITDNIDDVYITNIVKAPFIDSENGVKKGLINVITLIDSDCSNCFDITGAKNQILSSVKIKSEKTIDKNSAEGKELISKYNIEKIPTILLDLESKYYDELNSVWGQIGSTESDESKILRQIPAPYFDVEKDKIVGVVKMTVISDESCETCYDAEKAFTQISKNIGVTVSKTLNVDVASSELVEKYSLTKVPTVIYEGDLDVYPNFVKAWSQAGDEVNGSYIFRNVEILKLPYKDLTTGEVV